MFNESYIAFTRFNDSIVQARVSNKHANKPLQLLKTRQFVDMGVSEQHRLHFPGQD